MDIKNRIYIDNAASTQLLPEVVDSMLPFFNSTFGNPSSTHFFGREAKSAIEISRKKIATLLNSAPNEIYFTSGGTESNNMALRMVVESLNIKTLITSPIEHHSVLQTAESLTDIVDLLFVKVDENGTIDFNDLEELLKNNPKSLLSLMHANNEIGNLLDIDKASELVEKYNAVFHVDAVQTVGHYKVDLQKLKNVHLMSASSHKFHGPKGVGFLFIRKGLNLKSFIKGGAQGRKLRAGTENISGIVGMTKALELAYKDLNNRKTYIEGLKKQFSSNLNDAFPTLRINGEKGQSLYSVLNISFPKHQISDMLSFSLDVNGIAVSSGSACASGSNEVSHVLKAIGKNDGRPTVRFSFSFLNTQDELTTTINVLKSLMK